ncbi:MULTISPECIES: ATP-binding protein [Croceitalea]|uniref:ATP-binding protein n=1 Tax=Croceitalea vernalis TaxID=3075599 RepID=A0ABU3BGK7_9FLAO|nr:MULTISPECIES: ATP-binding protein [unclassified Croceitalea]MDT0539490.1 ATP-binding protein [Croceitalea sp. P059]MDT0621282.1 ATP-binding protein [Croceitalea sp. P007]
MNSKKIVITGAPGTGKTVVINQLEEKGFHCFHEIIRSMTADAKNDESSKDLVSNPLAFVNDPYQFNISLLNGRIEHFKSSKNLDKEVIFFDRGVPDVLAYMDYFNQKYNDKFIMACQQYKYDFLFIMPPWKEIYVSDNERLETFDEALALHECLMSTYLQFGYKPIIVPKSTIEERSTFILNELNLA